MLFSSLVLLAASLAVPLTLSCSVCVGQPNTVWLIELLNELVLLSEKTKLSDEGPQVSPECQH